MPNRNLDLQNKYAPFIGNGPAKIAPAWSFPGTAPLAMTYAEARTLIDRFLINGMSTHTGDGATVWVLIQWLQYQKFDYTLEAAPGYGYSLFRKNHRGPLTMRPERA